MHEKYTDMLALYALTTLDASDVRTLEPHLATCDECTRELQTWQAVVAGLALAAPPVEPSPQVRAAILERVRGERSLDALREERTSAVIPFRDKRSFKPVQLFGRIAAAIALVAITIVAVVLWKQNRAAQEQVVRLNTERAATQQELDRQRKIIELLSAPGAKIAMLSGTEQAPRAHATLAYDQQTGQAVLLAEGLPPVPRGKAYQLWFIAGNVPMPGRVFASDPTGKAVSNEQVPSEARKSAVFAITLEPENGVKAPTGAIYLRSVS